MPKNVPDIQTGYFGKDDTVETVRRAQKYAEEINTTAHVIHVDLANQVGVNEYFDSDNDKADFVIRPEANIFRQKVERYSPDAFFKRTDFPRYRAKRSATMTGIFYQAILVHRLE